MGNILKKKWSITGIALTILIVIAIAFIVVTMTGKTSGTLDSPGGQRGPGGKRGPGGQRGPATSSVVESETIYAVRTEVANSVELKDYIKLNGDIVTSTNIDIYPDTSGKLSKLIVSLGDYVVKGQTIAEIDPSLPGQVYSTSPVISTITGTIIDLPYKVGSTISSTQIPVATVGDLTDLLVQVYVSEKDIAAIKIGLDSIVTFDAYPGIQFHAVITEISPVLNKSSRTMEVKLSIKENDSRIKSGMFASIKLITEVLNNVITVSSVSLTESADEAYLYTIDEQGVAHKQVVETGLAIDGVVEIVSGLNPGDVVVNRGQSMIQDGSSVRISK
ncbi:MAG: hypothetical protein B6229_07880 [Spirochaetaceae bacterium 4572_7]|nr:MAG: hypothetical protein B6229_07880 [Spirochaetaceae bacterium 4572_7]